MTTDQYHPYSPDARFDGGNLDCGNGLLLLIRKHLDPLLPGQLLEIQSTEISVDEDLPAWARLTGNELVSQVRIENKRSFLVCKGKFDPNRTNSPTIQTHLPEPRRSPLHPFTPSPLHLPIPPLSVMGIGSWPRPRWMLQAIHEHLETRLSEAEFQQTADDAVRLAMDAQIRAGVDVVTDGEQRRDSYASFVGSRLEGCQLVPITDLLPYVANPEKFEQDLRALDVPATKVRHPALLGRIRRVHPLAVHELCFAQTLTDTPIKVALPGPYLLTRTLWMDCLEERAYPSREPLVEDIILVLREEIQELLDQGASLVQLDEPVLTEVVFGKPQNDRSFMCGALTEKRDPQEELAFAATILQRVLQGFPRDRLAMHVCRGNWSRDESVALTGDYTPLVPFFQQIPVGTFFLELCTSRAGELEVLADLPKDCRVGIGVVNQKLDEIESVESILVKAEKAIAIFGADRILLTPDCGFATFADNPIASAKVAEAKLNAIHQASRILRERYLN
jgi:5-methyltetrahydropteroyltriglutamate--homocysteine methyltransferase